MWSHYAAQYAGAMIEFDVSHDFFKGQIDVEYRPQRPKKHVTVLTEAVEPLPLSELCIKSKDWEYEAEVRIARSLAECEQVGSAQRDFPVFVQRIPPGAIKSVVFGERTKVIDMREVVELVRETNIGLLLAAVDQAGYLFRYERIKFNKPFSEMGPMMSPRTAHIFADRQAPSGEFARWMTEHHPLSKIVNKTV